MTDEEAPPLAEPDPCPMSCGRTTKDPYGGPCQACWAAVTMPGWDQWLNELVAFLRARLDDDEQIARATMWDGSDNVQGWHLSASATVETGGDTFYAGDRTVANHVERHDPARVLREVDAKRRMVARIERTVRAVGPHFGDAWILSELAVPYEDDAAYREDWRPPA